MELCGTVTSAALVGEIMDTSAFATAAMTLRSTPSTVVMALLLDGDAATLGTEVALDIIRDGFGLVLALAVALAKGFAMLLIFVALELRVTGMVRLDAGTTQYATICPSTRTVYVLKLIHENTGVTWSIQPRYLHLVEACLLQGTCIFP